MYMYFNASSINLKENKRNIQIQHKLYIHMLPTRLSDNRAGGL